MEVVGDGGVPADRNADLRQALTQPLAVRVEILPTGDLAADRNDFGFHETSWKVARGVGQVA